MSPSFSVLLNIFNQPNSFEGKISFETAAFGEIALNYLLPRMAKGAIVIRSAQNWSDIGAYSSDVDVSASMGVGALKAIGLLLGNKLAEYA